MKTETKHNIQNVALVYLEQPSHNDDEVSELYDLIRSAHGEVKLFCKQSRNTPDAKTLVGSGKVEEIKVALQNLDCQIDVVIFSQKLDSLQRRNLTEALCPTSRRVAAPISEDIYLMRSAKCTSILVECGFLSNPSEAALLQTEDYQLKISALLLASYLQYEAGSDGMVL